jgi:hypothetical protein
MTSKRKIKANRRNALNSTGPRSELGKRISSKNALTHGLCAKGPVTPWEAMETFNELRAELQAELHPEGSEQLALFEQILTSAWKSRRARWIEHGVTTDLLSQDPKRSARARFFQACESVVELDHLARYENELRIALRKAMLKLWRLKSSAGATDIAVSGGAEQAGAKIPERTQFSTQVQAGTGGMAK